MCANSQLIVDEDDLEVGVNLKKIEIFFLKPLVVG